MEIKTAKYFSVTAFDRPGEAAQFMRTLREENVDLAGMWGFSIGRGQAQFIAVPKKPDHFREAAKKANLNVIEGTCFHIVGEDKVGSLTGLLDRVASKGINLHAVDAITLDGRFGCYLWSDKEEDIDAIASLLHSA